MHANSRPVHSNQTGVHEQLDGLVARHAASVFRKPISSLSREAFASSIAAWQSHGKPPLVLDAGCGVGLSTRKLAQAAPDCFVIGVDQSADRLGREIRWPGLVPENAVTVRADLVDYWRLMLSEGIRPDQHFLLYPNPWPKKSQLGRRWHGHAVFPVLVALGGRIECRSNWKIYVEEFASALQQLSGIPARCEPHACTATEAITPFEAKYIGSGHTLWRCRAELPAGTALEGLIIDS
jgi:tRNA (guanine-N7-)-methyltransferase